MTPLKGIKKHIKEHIKNIATESLDIFKKISDSAKSHRTKSPTSGTRSLAASNSFTNPKAAENMQKIHDDNAEGYAKLIQKPVTARVVVIDENKEKKTYYICPAAPPFLDNASINLASYGSPVGRLAALPVGEEYPLPRGEQSKLVKITETAKYHPVLDDKGWDSQNSTLEGDGYGPVTIKSLRALLVHDPDKAGPTSPEGQPSGESWDEIVKEGIHRDVIKKVGLRDQPILDQYQDEIFRLPLDSRLLILGAPGTGKTTTLIKRLSQKLNMDFLDEDEKRMIKAKAPGAEADHAESWIMFAPTELLRLYVEEASDREGIPAPDEHIKTWTDFSEELACNEFRILSSESKKRSFEMKESLQNLNMDSEKKPIEWFSDFDQWQKSVFWKAMRVSAEKLSKERAEKLSENQRDEVAQLSTKFLDVLKSARSEVKPSIFKKLMQEADEIQKLIQEMTKYSDKKIRESFNLQVNKDKRFLDDLAAFVEGLPELTDDSEDQDVDIEDDEATKPPQRERPSAENLYMQAARAHAKAQVKKAQVKKSQVKKAQVKKRKTSKPTQNDLLIEWLGDRSLPDKDLKEVGEILRIQSALRPLANFVRLYIDGIPKRYGRFRRERQAENKWYHAEKFDSKGIHPLEVDLLLLAMIRSTNDLIKSAPTLGNDNSRAKATLERLQNLYCTQVLVDEVSDFSPIQLSCMAALARPGIQSFFACGDFNQSLTNCWGTHPIEQMKWAVPNIETQTVSKAYRQSHQLHTLANKIVNLSGDKSTDNVNLAEYAENEGVPPVLATQMNEVPRIADWLASRIEEIKNSLDELPSIAVLVSTEKEVRPLAKALDDALTDQNISVEACINVLAHSQDNAVRVFDVQHIKGLEFEAVFFVSLDRLADIYPDLFNKYLYVGATRAATYLGITCEQELPSDMTELKESFEEKWS